MEQENIVITPENNEPDTQITGRQESDLNQTENNKSDQKEKNKKKKKEKSKEKRKRNALLGWIAFALIVVSFGILAYMGLSAWSAYSGGNLGDIPIGLMLNLMGVVLIVSGLSFLISLTALFLSSQKKGMAITSMIIAFLILLLIGGARYTYHVVFESDSYDEAFSEIPEEELYIKPNWRTEEINFEEIPEETMSKEDVEQLMALKEVDWPYLEEADIPDHVYSYMNSQSQESPCYLKPGAEQIENFVLFGIDDNGLSDVIMVVSMDRVHNKIKLISIQRDSYVRVPGWGGYTKINHAYGVGKEESSLATLNLNFKLNIKDYFTLHFSQVEALIDILGGVDVYLDRAEVSYMHGYGHPNLVEGPNHLTGAEAVTYSRMRSSSLNDNEVRRTGRQREVLNALYSSCKSAPVSSYPALVDTFTDLCKTSVSGEWILSMVLEALSEGYTIENHALINYVKCWGGQIGLWYFIYDLDVAGDILYRLIYEELYVSGYPENDVVNINGY